MTVLEPTTSHTTWRPGEAPTAADGGLPNMVLASLLALVCLAAAVLVYAAIIRFALNWSRSRWDPEGDSTPLNED